MRYRAILRNFERRAPKPRPTIRVRWIDGETIYIKGDDWSESGRDAKGTPPHPKLPRAPKKDSPTS